jgi:predicted DNA-binding protein YlxM (UPF0122 family)
MILSIPQAAKQQKVTRQAIYEAIRKKRLIAKKDEHDWKWQINIKDLEEYNNHKFDRKKSTFEGGPLYDSSKGEYSVKEIAKYLKTTPNQIYYAVKRGYLKAFQKSAAWVIKMEDVSAYKKFKEINGKRVKKENIKKTPLIVYGL